MSIWTASPLKHHCRTWKTWRLETWAAHHCTNLTAQKGKQWFSNYGSGETSHVIKTPDGRHKKPFHLSKQLPIKSRHGLRKADLGGFKAWFLVGISIRALTTWHGQQAFKAWLLVAVSIRALTTWHGQHAFKVWLLVAVSIRALTTWHGQHAFKVWLLVIVTVN